MNEKTYSKSKTFHGHFDTELSFNSSQVIKSREKYYIVQERELAYRFYLHQHPYVQSLTQRLLRKGTKGLQAADTEFNTRIRLTKDTSAKNPYGQPIELPRGEVVYLVDGSTAKLGEIEVRFSGGKVLDLSDSSSITPPMNQAVKVSGSMTLRRNNGAVVVTDGETEAMLVDGVPLPVLYGEIFSASQYNPSELVQQPYPVKDIDFTSSGAYAVYNWELFYHVPLTIAIHLSKNQRFSEAQRWFHYLFDPTDDSDGPTPERFWKVRPFQYTDVQKIEKILVNLATGADAELRNETIRSIEAWKDAPFRPHVVARYRQQAYMYKTVMAYLDNLIAWGDSLFRQDTGEAIDEARMFYVLAANILGPKPLPVPKKGTIRPQTYDNLRNDLTQFGTVMRDMEPEIPFDLMPFPTPDSGTNTRLATLRSLGKALYFCVPRNDKLIGYWDTVADRLFKIHNSLNIQGIFRQLPLFEPPIDPALLARAAAAGLDVAAIVNGLSQPLPLVRFSFLVQKAAEIAQEVKSLGNSLLSAMEKEDGEALALLRAKHERAVMEMVEHVKYGQLQEVIKAKEGLLQTMALAVQRYTFYEKQLGRKAEDIENSIPEFTELDRDSLAKMKFAMDEPELLPRDVSIDIVNGLGGSGGRILSSYEADELSKLSTARDIQDAVRYIKLGAQGLGLIPDFSVDLHFWGMGGHSDISGGTRLSHIASFAADVAVAIADHLSYEAGAAAKIGSYARREQDWAFQSNLAAGEINQIFKQIRAAEIRQAIAKQELENHQLQMRHAEEIEYFLNEEGIEKKGKKTNKALYAWMKREVKGLYSQSFQFAFDIAKKAERALQHELGNPELSYLQFGYLAGKEGLLAGERLYLDIKRMEMAYHEQNRREYEMTKHVSLLQVDPLAIIQLRTTGRCTVRLPEMLFDMDGPGNYFRRIKSVALSIPCVAGPYAGVNCKLTLLKSSIRKSPILRDGEYGRQGIEDDRFSDHFGSLQSIVTSSAQNDSGLFETNLRDERYLPFENAGVISEWQLELPADIRQFDYNTISDVILHLRYTARDGGDLLSKGAVEHQKALIKGAQAPGSVRLFSVRHEFPTEWAKFQGETPAANERHELKFVLRPEHYPFWAQGWLNGVTRVDVLARSTQIPCPPSLDIFVAAEKANAEKKCEMMKDNAMNDLLVGQIVNASLPKKPVDEEVKFFLEDKKIENLWVALTWNNE
jgi:hypothetical protein